ncbi:DUF554 domain-containing protein [Miniphocaeibacter halophilus]|uniref:DUF554 domain-containing protein n=1 Tax=Miniphocaeibacter halophilus TaxID=2931922 RepID=A0AC61MMV0_9FIRM|nr:DUF554 domain-containing protein [Miniphocaeibacter halophilus]QQK06995.1 DUF554 domain-containing protein [Miniphocaeibacter halophilus]
MGTIINTALVVLGGIFGTYFGRKISKNIQESLMKIIGVAVLFIGITGTLQYMLVIDGNNIKTQGTMMLIISLALGTIVGEILKIEDKIHRLGQWIKGKFNKKEDNYFVEGFVNTSLIICVGAMGIVGSIQNGLTGDYSMLVAKGALDFVIVMINGSLFGIGAAFAAMPMFIYQGAITVIAILSGNFIGTELINNISMVGATLVFCIGINLVWGNKIKVGNSIPALLIPIIYSLFI